MFKLLETFCPKWSTLICYVGKSDLFNSRPAYPKSSGKNSSSKSHYLHHQHDMDGHYPP